MKASKKIIVNYECIKVNCANVKPCKCKITFENTQEIIRPNCCLFVSDPAVAFPAIWKEIK